MSINNCIDCLFLIYIIFKIYILMRQISILINRYLNIIRYIWILIIIYIYITPIRIRIIAVTLILIDCPNFIIIIIFSCFIYIFRLGTFLDPPCKYLMYTSLLRKHMQFGNNNFLPTKPLFNIGLMLNNLNCI